MAPEPTKPTQLCPPFIHYTILLILLTVHLFLLPSMLSRSALPLLAGAPVRVPVPVPHPCVLGTALGAWGALVDAACEAPLLSRAGGAIRSPLHSHEGNLDFSSFLYTDTLGAVIVDEVGPVCMLRAFLAIGFTSLTPNVNPEGAVIRIEVDGAIAITGTLREIFMNRSRLGASYFDFSGDNGGGGSEPLLSTLPSLPSTHVFTLERGAAGTLESGALLSAPICAARRLRVALDYVGRSTNLVNNEPTMFDVMLEAAHCVAAQEKCTIVQYANVQVSRFARELPSGWEPFTISPPFAAPAVSAALAAAGIVARNDIFSPARLLREAHTGAESARGGVVVGDLRAGVPLLLLDTHGAGTVTALEIDVPGARALLHSLHLRLVAVWDGGGTTDNIEQGYEDEGASGIPPEFSAQGWSDTESVSASQHDRTRTFGATLDIDLGSLLGPALMGDQRISACRKELLLIGERPGGGFYLTAPMPFWASARIELVWGASQAELDAALAGAAPQVKARVSLGGPVYSRGEAGYLQGHARNFSMVEGMRGNMLGAVRGQRGMLVYIAADVVAKTQNFVEGDVRVWTDGNPTPSIWESGWEDFFDGSHGYRNDLHHCGEGAFAYDRVDAPGWGYSNETHVRVHFFQARLLLNDALAFDERMRIAVEGLPIKFGAQIRSAVLWYGVAAPPLRSTDMLRPADDWDLPGGGAHAYAVTGVAVSDLLVDMQRSVLSSYGEETLIKHTACYRSKRCVHEGIVGGVVLTRGVLRVPPLAIVSFTLAIDPRAERVFLRRLIDLRHGLHRAALFVNGVFVRMLQSSDRPFAQMHASWAVDIVHLPPDVTRGRKRIRVELRIESLLAEATNTSRAFQLFVLVDTEGSWPEAQWEAVCVMPISDVALRR